MSYTCCICGKEFFGWGNNPFPIIDDEDSVCCDECNASIVLPERFARISRQVLTTRDNTEGVTFGS